MLDNELTDFGKEYLQLGLRINKHINGYIDYYYGPRNIKLIVENENIKSPKNLLKACKSLQNQLRNQAFDENRIKYFDKTLLAIHTILQKLDGEKIPYLTLIENIFDFTPEFYDDDYFYNLAIKANELYRGTGSLYEKMNKYAEQRTIPLYKLENFFKKAISVARNRTKELFPNLLPASENVNIEFVENKRWWMYNWYLGNFKSRIEVNKSNNVYWTDLLNFACHEGYPGHHTESSTKEYLLYRKRSLFEVSIKLLYTPDMVISEGIATTADLILFTPKEMLSYLLENFCINPELEDSLEILVEQSLIKRNLRYFEHKLAYYKYVEGWENEKLKRFVRELGIYPEEGLNTVIQYISDEIGAIYSIIYQGELIIKKKYGEHPDPNHFLELITNQILPSDIYR